MEFKLIEVDGQKYTAMRLPDAAEVAQQHLKFLEIFERSSPEAKAQWANSSIFGDPTEGLSNDILADTYDNIILIPEVLMCKLDVDPKAEVNNDPVYLVKPSGVYAMTYLQSMENQFPRIMNTHFKTELNPATFIKALNG